MEKSKVYIREVLGDLRQDGNGRILLIVSLGWFFSIGIRYTYPTLLPFFQETFDISLSTASLLVTGLWIAYAGGQFPGGILGDKIGEGNILVVSSFLSMVGIAVVAVSNTIILLFTGTIAFGFATALYGPTRYTIFTDIYSKRSGIAIGLTLAAGSIGNALLPVAAAIVATHTSWQLGFGALVPIFIIISIALWIILPKRTSAPINNESPLSVSVIRRILGATVRDGIPIVLTAHVVVGFVTQGFLALYPTYLVNIKSLSPSGAAALYGFYFILGVGVQPVVGIGRDYFGDRAMLIAVIGGFFSGLLLLPLTHGIIPLGLLTILLSCRNGVPLITNTYISTSLPEDIKGSGLGLLRTGWILIGATSPALIGFYADAGYFQEAFFALALLAGAAMVLTVFIPEK